MDILDRSDLEALAAEPNGWAVSIYMPTHEAGAEFEQDPIRFKNLLDEAEEELIAAGLRPPEARDLLEPAREVEEDDLFWQQQGGGLSMFIAPGQLQHYRLPIEFEPLAVVASRFHLKPLLPLLSGNGRFLVLALSQKSVRLLLGSRFTIGEVDLERVSDGLAEVLRFEDPERRLQLHTTTQTPGGKGERPAAFHGHGVASEDDPKDRIRRYFQRVDEALSEEIADLELPLVLSGVDYLLPIYREANTYPHLMDEGAEGNPDELSPEEIHGQTWPIAHTHFQESREDAAALYRQLAGTDDEQASNEIREVVPAAYYGRVDTLFVALDAHRWGTFDPEANRVEIHEEAEPQDEDLLNLAAVHTMLNGGAIYAVESEEVPDGAPLAALLRYPMGS